MNSFKGRTALVTGASSGIGEAIAELLAQRGANLILVARSKDKLDALAGRLRASVTVDVVAMDLSAPDAAARLFEETTRLGRPVDVLINNAGFGKWGAFLDVDLAAYLEMTHLNIDALMALSYLYLPAMIARGDGAILNVGSTASFISLPWTAVYAATKAFVLSFSEALSYEVKSKGVQVTALCPGATASNFATVANASVDATKDAGATSASVAAFGLDALLAGKMTAIPGAENQMTALLPRLLGRKRTVRIAGEAWKKRMAARGVRV